MAAAAAPATAAAALSVHRHPLISAYPIMHSLHRNHPCSTVVNPDNFQLYRPVRPRLMCLQQLRRLFLIHAFACSPSLQCFCQKRIQHILSCSPRSLHSRYSFIQLQPPPLAHPRQPPAAAAAEAAALPATAAVVAAPTVPVEVMLYRYSVLFQLSQLGLVPLLHILLP